MHLSYVKASLDDAWLWRCILGYASMHALYKLVKHYLVGGLPFRNMRTILCVVLVLEVSKYMLSSTFEECVNL